MAKKARVWDGTAWQELASAQTDLTGYPALATNQFGFRNKIINGDFRINQRRYASAANLASGSYGFDRWKSNFTNTTLTFTSAPQGQSLTINSGGGLQQVIERANMPAGNYVLTFTGTATGRVYNSGGTAPSYAASPVTVTLDGSADVVVEFTASGGTATLQNVQLEAGSVASAFERRPIATEITLCHRYYRRNDGGDDFAFIGTVRSLSSTAIRVYVPLIVPFRIEPAITVAGTVRYENSGGQFALATGSPSAIYYGNPVQQTMIAMDHAITGGPAAGTFGDCYALSGAATNYMEFSAEL